LNFPSDIANDKLISLVETKVVKLNEKSFNFSEDDQELRVCLIVNNLQEYFRKESDYPLEDEVKEAIVFSNIENSSKIKIARNISPTAVDQSRRLSLLISEFLVLPHITISDFSASVVSGCIINAKDTKTSILILSKAIGVFSNADILALLSQLPEPYSEIAEYGKSPKLPKTDENVGVAELLKAHEIISSFKDDGDKIRLHTFKSAKGD
jgi:hypothetical protein